MPEVVNKVLKMKNPSSKKAIKVLSLLSAVLVTFILFSYYLVEGHGIFISLASSLLVALLVYGFVLICLQQLLGQNGKEFKAPGSFTSNKNNRISLVNAPDDIESLKKLTDYVVLDTETTGLSPEKDQVVEIGIITVKNGEITNEYTSLIKPTIPISSEATAINGISESDLRDAPQLEDIIPDVVSRIKNQIVVGHNVTFDLAFVSRAISDHTEIASIDLIVMEIEKDPENILQVLKERSKKRRPQGQRILSIKPTPIREPSLFPSRVFLYLYYTQFGSIMQAVRTLL